MRKTFFCALAFALTLPLLAFPEFSLTRDNHGHPYLSIRESKKRPIRLELDILSEGQYLFHWTGKEWAEEVDRQSCLTPSNMDYLRNKGVASGFRQYGGFYVSTDMWDSAWYGTELLILKLKLRAVLVPFNRVFQRNILRAFEGNPMHLQNALIDAGIDGTYKHHGLGKVKWINLFNVQVTQGVRMATQADFEDCAINRSFLFERGLLNKTIFAIVRYAKRDSRKNLHFLEHCSKH